MALYADRVKDSTSITGTGAITLSGTAPTGFQSFATAFGATPQTVAYCIADQTGNNWEVGTGVFNGTTGLTRVAVLASSNGGSLVNFTGGTQDVFCTAPAAYLLPPGANTQVAYNNAGLPGASANFTYTSGTNTVSFGNITGSALSMTIQPKVPTSLEDPGTLLLQGSNATKTNTNGGSITLKPGAKTGTGNPGSVFIQTQDVNSLVEFADAGMLCSGPYVSSFSFANGSVSFLGAQSTPIVDVPNTFIAGLNSTATGNVPFQFFTDSQIVFEFGESTFGSQEMAFFGVTPEVQQASAPAATDLATVITLTNALRTALLNLGLIA
jgi:hypothetical protein